MYHSRDDADIDYVPGSNLLLEKLASGRWDEQFFIVELNKRITQGNFFDVYRLCPNGIYMHPNIGKYMAVSRQLHDLL